MSISISSSAMLVELSISTWTARKLDKSVTDEVNTNKKASSSASRVNKHLLPEVKQLKEIIKYAESTRNWMYTKTLPWSDFGARLIPTANFFEFKQELDSRTDEFYRMVDEFVDEYPNLISAQAFKLGDMFNRDEYPEAEEIRGKFRLRASFMPVPDSGDFRVDVGNEAMAELKEQYEADFEKRMKVATTDIAERLISHLSRVADRMTDNPDGTRKTFRASLFDTLSDTIASVRILNVTKDEALDRMADAASDALNTVNVDVLRDTPLAREKLKGRVDEILDNFNF
jgi:hypothetical protein